MKKQLSLLSTLLGAVILLLALWEIVLAAAILKNDGTTLDEGETTTILNSKLQVSDINLPGEIYTFTINPIPADGTLFKNGLPLTTDSTFTQIDIDNNIITYTHDGNDLTTSDGFGFIVKNITGTSLFTDTFLFTITPINDPPTAVPDTLRVFEGANVTVTEDGNSSLVDNDTDPEDQGTLTTTTSAIIDPSTGSVTIGSSGSFDYAHNDNEVFIDSFTYRVCDDEPSCTDGSVTVIITPVVDIAPIINPHSLNINENSSNNDLVGTVVVTDTEVDTGYDTLTYTITSGNQNNAFSLNQTTGEVRVNNENELNHETNSSITLTVQVEDLANGSDSAIITIFVNDINEPPDIPTGQSFNIDENSNTNDIVDNVAASDIDDGDQISYEILGGNIGGAFKIIATTGQLRVANGSQLDYETRDTYSLNIQVMDDGNGNLINAATVTVHINPINEEPSISNQTLDIDENSANSANVGVIAASDPEVDDPNQTDSLQFAILSGNDSNAFLLNSGNGQITVNDTTALDHETTDQFILTVVVTDTGTLNDTATITIDVNDINEAPTITPDQSFSIPENSINSTLIGPISADDEDDGDDVFFSITGGNIDNAFDINVNSGEITVTNMTALDFETNPTFVLSIEATDGSLPVTDAITISLTNVNETPFITSGQTFTVTGNSNIDTIVGTVDADDPDAGDILNYTIESGNINQAFKIDSFGEISVKTSSALDFDTRPIFTLAIRVTDILGKTYDESVQINLTAPPIYYVHIPLILNNFHPEEPNNNCSQSYSISTNLTHTFSPDDTEDWYKFTLPKTKNNVQAILSNYIPAGQIIAYKGNCTNPQFIMNNGSSGTTKVLNLGTLSAGTYYIRIFTDVPSDTLPAYNLKIVTP
ncbi:MAG: hypothetical protein GY943_02810 [Chloroflexi bacterium]|nr:hypothetical protein [Chloroflexota bacterium]